MAKPAMQKMKQILHIPNMPRVISDISLLVIEPENGFRSIDEFLSMCKTANLMGLGALPIDLQRGTMEFGGKECSVLFMSMRIMDKMTRGPFLCCDWINTYLDLDMNINPIPARVAAHFKAWLEVRDNMKTGSGETNRNIYRPDGKFIKDIEEGKQFMEIVKDNFSAYELERVAKEGEQTMFEISITWWKMKGDPDPDQTPEWTSVIPGTYAATQRNTVARLQKLFRCAEDFSRSHRWGPSTRGAVPGAVYLPGSIEKGTPAQHDFEPANRPFPSAHGDIIPAMRVRYVASYDFGFKYYRWSSACMDNAILTRFSQPEYPGAEGYVPAEEFLARRLIGASVLWRDAHHVCFCLPCIAGDDEVEKLEYEPQLELWPARTPFEKSFVYKKLEKKLGEYLPAWYLRKTVAGV